MPRGISWDRLPLPHERYNKHTTAVATATTTNANATATATNATDSASTSEIEAAPRDIVKDVTNIGRRAAFGLICGSITGACLGTVEILRDPKLIIAKKSIATAKIFRFSYMFGGFFASYHGYRKIIHTYYPMPAENNVFAAAVLSLAPLAAVNSWRYMFPYGVFLIALDCINGLKDL